MRMLLVRLSGVLGLSLALTAALHAPTTGSIRGVVETGQTTLPGVTVEAKSPNLQGSRTSITDAEGRFNLTNLPPGTYTITATLEGMGTTTQTVPLAMTQAAVIR